MDRRSALKGLRVFWDEVVMMLDIAVAMALGGLLFLVVAAARRRWEKTEYVSGEALGRILDDHVTSMPDLPFGADAGPWKPWERNSEGELVPPEEMRHQPLPDGKRVETQFGYSDGQVIGLWSRIMPPIQRQHHWEMPEPEVNSIGEGVFDGRKETVAFEAKTERPASS